MDQLDREMLHRICMDACQVQFPFAGTCSMTPFRKVKKEFYMAAIASWRMFGGVH